MALEEWRSWDASLPKDLPDRARYTATLLRTLAQILYTAPFRWALTGGTALQSRFTMEHRRYSTDLEIITPAGPKEVAAWMQSQGWPPEKVDAAILKCALAPEGTLFVIHSYPERDFAAAEVATTEFQHYPVPTAGPPESLHLPLCSFDFLLATKLFGIQEEVRGGERKKDAYDLAIGLPTTTTDRVLGRLKAYALHRGREGEAPEIARSAGAWLAHFGGSGFGSFARWLVNFVPDARVEDVRQRLDANVGSLSAVLGKPVEPTGEERCRFLAHELTPAEVVPLAKAFGFKGDPLKQSEKMLDHVIGAALPRMALPLPTDRKGLMEALRKAGVTSEGR